MITFFSNQQLTIKDVWTLSLRLYREVFPGIWFLATILGVLLNISLFGIFYLFKPTTTIATIACVIAFLLTQLLDIYLAAVILHRIYIINIKQNSSLYSSLYSSFTFVNKKYSTILICDFFAGFFILLGIMIFVIPGIYMKIVFFMLQPLILFDNKGVFAALRESFQLVRGNWWCSFVTFFPLLFCITGLTIFAMWFIAIDGFRYLLMGFNILFVTLFYPLWDTFILLQFNNLQSRKTGLPLPETVI